MPGEARAGEQQAPVLDGGVELDGFLARGARDQEGVFVGAFEEVGGGGQVSPELRD